MPTTLSSGLMSSVKKGKQILQKVLRANTQIVVKVAKPKAPETCHVRTQPVRLQNLLQEIWRGIIPRVYYNSLAAQLGRQTAWRAGRNAPLLAFLGLAVAQNKDKDEHEMTSRIQEFLKIASPCEQPVWGGVEQFSLGNFDLGSRIGQGCNAAVYEARWKDLTSASDESADSASALSESVSEITDLVNDESLSVSSQTDNMEVSHTGDKIEDVHPAVTDMGSHENQVPISNGDDVDDFTDTDSDITIISWKSDDQNMLEEGAPLMFTVEQDSGSEFSVITSETSGDDFDVLTEEEVESATDKVSDTVQRKAVLSTNSVMQWLHQLEGNHAEHQPEIDQTYQSMDSSVLLDDGRTRPKLKYDLAVKMMFNYDIESNATAILKCMEKETIPAQFSSLGDQEGLLKSSDKDKKKYLPMHPNIVEMWGVFVDPVPSLPDGLINYPAALPNRINPEGMGRNMTMFIVMKRYDMTLTEYLSLFDLTFRERIYLLAQLLEAVDHLYKHGIAHRDMKADNILIDTTHDGPAQLVLSDFGCCLADPNCGLMLPYSTDETDKGGNTALMAPEISCAKPAPYAKLDYRKADLWGVGAIAYEILGADNPFYSSENGKLDSRTYNETELPPLAMDIPLYIRTAVSGLLSRDPNKRPSARQVLNTLYAYLWGPVEWLDTMVKVEITKQEVMWWIITMATDLLLKQRSMMTNTVDMTLMALFIRHFNFRQFCKVLNE